MRLFFCRHGQSTANAIHVYAGQDRRVTLTDLGRRQATQAGRAMQDWGIDTIISSDLDRAHETAGIIAGQIGLELSVITTDERLREVNAGRMTGQPEHGFVEYLKYARSGIDPTAETMEQVCDRLQPLLAELPLGSSKTVLLVAHAGIGRALQALLTGRTIDELAVESVANAAPFELPLNRLATRNKETGGTKL